MSRAKSAPRKEAKQKEVAQEFFKFIMAGRPKEARHLFAANCKHHNPYLRQGMDALLESMAGVQTNGIDGTTPNDVSFDIEHVLADGDLVAVHTNLSSRSDARVGLRQVHLFRFRGGRVVEYWDVTQMVPKEARYPRRMF